MHCTLLVPHLFWPREAGIDVYQGISADSLNRLVSRSTQQSFPHIALDAWLCQAFEVERQHDWPSAPLTLALDGGDPGAAYWLRADPAHIKINRDQLMLAEAGAVGITAAEADALRAVLERHFESEGYRWFSSHPERWYLSPRRIPEIQTSALHVAAGGNAANHLPTGAGALAWHRIWNEAQMVLHDHPVNLAREARGALPINSLWFWGGGERPAVPGRHFGCVSAREPLALALALASGAESADVPESAERWLKTASTAASQLVVLDRLDSLVRYGDRNGWRETLMAFEEHWFSPLIDALQRRRISGLALVAPCQNRCWRFELRSVDLLKFWRRSRPLETYA